MPTMHFTLKTTATPEQFRAGLTDFGPGRAKLFANSKDGYLKGAFARSYGCLCDRRLGGHLGAPALRLV